ncbi:uncharacterized protein LOC143424896 [Xylocopa sonorina]|uniref:uncharacterized protein LOC143424896 n=1 Tax=Xylocopa sonorina TaxID=1818115 RepID=UPI00403AC425
MLFLDKKMEMESSMAMKNTKMKEKRVKVDVPAVTTIKKKKNVAKTKIIVPKTKPNVKVTKNLFISNIKCGTKVNELKAVLPGCLSAKMLKPYSQDSKAAIVRMQSIQMAAEYLEKMREPPTIAGRKLRINPDTRIRIKRHNSKPLKIYDGTPETDTLDHIVLENKV